MPGSGQGGGPNFTGERLDVTTANIGTLTADNATIGGQSLSPACSIVPAGSLSPWQNALARAMAGTGTATAWFTGASTAQGASAVTNVITKATPGAYRTAKIAAGYPLGGDFFISTYSSNWSGNTAPNGWPFVNNIAPAAWNLAGPWWCPQYNATGVTLATPQMSYVHPSTDLGYNARSFRIYYWDLGNQDGAGSGVGYTWKYNTAASESGATTVTLLGDNLIHSFDITGLANTAGNAVYFGNQSNAAGMAIIGVLACPGTSIATSGVFYCRMGQPGHCMGDLAGKGARYPADKISLYIGPAGSSAPFTPNSALSPVFAPDLAIIEPFDDPAIMFPGTLSGCGVSPTGTVVALDPDDYKWGLERMAYSFRRKATGCTVVHELYNYPDNFVSDTSISALYVAQNFGEYFDAHIAIAARYGHIVSNTNQNWGGLGVTYAYLTATNPHPNDNGAGTAAPAGSPPAYLKVQARGTRWLGLGL